MRRWPFYVAERGMFLSEIEWKSVVGYEELYEVSSAGDVRRIGGSEPKLTGSLGHTNGYRYVTLSRKGHKHYAHIHCLVAEAFLGQRPPGMNVNHKDHKKTNNCVTNLEYVTQRENVRQAIAAGRHPAASPVARLSRGALAAALERLSEAELTDIKTSEKSYCALMNRYHIPGSIIRSIRKGDVLLRR